MHKNIDTYFLKRLVKQGKRTTTFYFGSKIGIRNQNILKRDGSIQFSSGISKFYRFMSAEATGNNTRRTNFPDFKSVLFIPSSGTCKCNTTETGQVNITYQPKCKNTVTMKLLTTYLKLLNCSSMQQESLLVV